MADPEDSDEFEERVRERLREALASIDERGQSRAKVAKQMGFGQTSFNKWFTHSPPEGIVRFARLCREMGWSADELFGLRVSPTSPRFLVDRAIVDRFLNPESDSERQDAFEDLAPDLTGAAVEITETMEPVSEREYTRLRTELMERLPASVRKTWGLLLADYHSPLQGEDD